MNKTYIATNNKNKHKCAAQTSAGIFLYSLLLSSKHFLPKIFYAHSNLQFVNTF